MIFILTFVEASILDSTNFFWFHQIYSQSYLLLFIPISSYLFLFIFIYSYLFIFVPISSYFFLFIPISSYFFLFLLIYSFLFLFILIWSYTIYIHLVKLLLYVCNSFNCRISKWNKSRFHRCLWKPQNL